MTTRRLMNLKANQDSRRGAMLILVAVSLILLIVVLVFSVDIAYMQLTKTELRTVTDAAARAAAESLSREQSEPAAIAAAQTIAAQNLVAGSPYTVAAEDLEFGRVEVTQSVTSPFVAGVEPPNAVRLVTTRSSGSTNGPVSLFFGRLLGRGTFEPSQSAVAAQLDRDICLVLDHSGSMATDGKFQALSNSLDVFLNEISLTDQTEHLSLVGYSTSSAKLQELTPDVTLIQSAFAQLSPTGYTAIGLGMQDGIDSLTTDANRRPYAQATMIVMTDGIHNTGIAPEDVVDTAVDNDIVVHTITFGDGADQVRMESIAATGHGQHFHAPDEEALKNAFRVIASTLPVVLTE